MNRARLGFRAIGPRAGLWLFGLANAFHAPTMTRFRVGGESNLGALTTSTCGVCLCLSTGVDGLDPIRLKTLNRVRFYGLRISRRRSSRSKLRVEMREIAVLVR